MITGIYSNVVLFTNFCVRLYNMISTKIPGQGESVRIPVYVIDRRRLRRE